MRFLSLSMVTGLLLWPTAGSAELYKWTDEQGNLHITDAPPQALGKKSAPAPKPNPRAAQPMKAIPTPSGPTRSQAEVFLVPEPSVAPTSPTGQGGQLRVEGLNPNLATVTSAWQIFDDIHVNANMPVQRWTDERGLEHFVDVLPNKQSSRSVEVPSGRPRVKTP